LFRGNTGRKDYRALYTFDGDQCLLVLSSGQAPYSLTSEMIEDYWRYNSG